ncbi:MAG TPA: DUF4249 family protein [Flavobacteriales bacterium]|nr:DUF4249 family protein [Flavobacteriales bacterium]
MTIRLFLLGGIAAFSLAGCNPELDVTAPYKESTVVYAMLDKDSTTQYIKINKTFLGPGNAFEYAQVPDSTEFREGELEAVIHKVKNGVVVASYTLRDTIWSHDPGIFAGPYHKLYYFTAALDSSATYRLEATAKGVLVRAETPIVGRVAPAPNILSQPLRLVAVGGGYVSPLMKFASADFGRRYDVSYRFRWDDVVGTDTISRSFTQSMGSVVSNGIVGGEALSVTMSGESFFQTVGLRAGNNTAASRRIFRGVDMIWATAGPDLYNYLQLGSPISGLVEERPTYTNVENGYGLFSTRRFLEVTFNGLNAQTIPELVQGQYTAGLNFCVPGSSEFGCD